MKPDYFCCSGDETLKPQTGIRRESISSDEENETSLDVSDVSACEDESDVVDTDTDSDEHTQTDTVPRATSEHHAAQVCVLHLLVIMIVNISLDCY